MSKIQGVNETTGCLCCDIYYVNATHFSKSNVLV